MTANKTQRLGLMLPQGTDAFTPDDFDETFGILDDFPGIKTVAAYSNLPTNLTSNQHGRYYMTTNYVSAYGSPALWMWYRPTTAAGSWKRVNSVGMLGRTTLGAAVQTSAATAADGPTTLALNNVLAPGGRELMVVVNAVELNNDVDPWHSAYMGLFVNGTYVRRVSAIGSSDGAGASPTLVYHMSAPAPGTSYDFKVTHYAQSHGGHSTMQAGLTLAVYEL